MNGIHTQRELTMKKNWCKADYSCHSQWNWPKRVKVWYNIKARSVISIVDVQTHIVGTSYARSDFFWKKSVTRSTVPPLPQKTPAALLKKKTFAPPSLGFFLFRLPTTFSRSCACGAIYRKGLISNSVGHSLHSTLGLLWKNKHLVLGKHIV